MEDFTAVVLETEPERRAFLAVFDGHGGGEAAYYARRHLWENIKAQKGFDSDDTEKVKAAIKEGFLTTHWDMWNEVGKRYFFVVLSIVLTLNSLASVCCYSLVLARSQQFLMSGFLVDKNSLKGKAFYADASNFTAIFKLSISKLWTFQKEAEDIPKGKHSLSLITPYNGWRTPFWT